MSEYKFREARREDVGLVVEMLADDELGKARETLASPLPKAYYDAFEAIERDPNNELIVCTLEDRIVGALQLTFIPYLAYTGGWRALIEDVRVAAPMRGRGIGHKLFEWAIERAIQRNCRIVQLTTNKSRPNAIRFYQSLGFKASHEGMKLEPARTSTYRA